MRPATSFLAYALLAAGAVSASAHPGAHHDIERLTKLLTKDPGRVDLIMDRARAYRFDGQPAQSLKDLDQVEKLGGDASLIALERGLALVALRRDAEAEAQLTKHLTGPNPRAIAFAERAALRERGRRAATAIEDYTAALTQAADVEWYLHRGRLQESLHKLDDAATGYREGLARCGGAVAIRLELLRLEIARGHYDAATTLIDAVIAQAAIKSEWYLRRAEVRAAAGQNDEARRDREQALAEADKAVARRATALRLVTRAKVLIAMDQKERAAADLRVALKKAPALVEAADLLKSVEQSEKAKRPVANAKDK